jgi:lipid A disaccharide synthetase
MTRVEGIGKGTKSVWIFGENWRKYGKFFDFLLMFFPMNCLFILKCGVANGGEDVGHDTDGDAVE